MEVIKLGTNNSKSFRIIKDEYELTPEINNYNTGDVLEIISYSVQVRILFIWFTIKEYSYGYRLDSKETIETITKEQYYCELCAEELYSHLLKRE